MNAQHRLLALWCLVIGVRVPVPAQATHGELDYVDRTMRGITTLRIRAPISIAAFDSCVHVMHRYKAQQSASGDERVVFPVRGRDCASIPGRGKGYVGSEEYSLFDGNRHRGHPAMDIFILDRDMDSRDDRTMHEVDVVSISDGIVISATRGWTQDSVDVEGGVLRGGICVWIYQPRQDALMYYAHLRDLAVHVGETVTAGSLLGHLGRTGKNAAPPRSSTHLHLMCLSLHGTAPAPRNIYDMLCAARPTRSHR
jgi:peptidoglycan LD-endopeptidase LytH